MYTTIVGSILYYKIVGSCCSTQKKNPLATKPTDVCTYSALTVAPSLYKRFLTTPTLWAFNLYMVASAEDGVGSPTPSGGKTSYSNITCEALTGKPSLTRHLLILMRGYSPGALITIPSFVSSLKISDIFSGCNLNYFNEIHKIKSTNFLYICPLGKIQKIFFFLFCFYSNFWLI